MITESGIRLFVEPLTVPMPFEVFRGPYKLAIDGYCSGPPRIDLDLPSGTLNHHENVEPWATRSCPPAASPRGEGHVLSHDGGHHSSGEGVRDQGPFRSRGQYPSREPWHAPSSARGRWLSIQGKYVIPDECLVARDSTVYVDGTPFRIDVLLYHPRLKQYLVMMFRKGPYRAGFESHANFLAEIVHRHLTGPEDRETLALVVCDSLPNKKLVTMCLTGWRRPIGVVARENGRT